MTQTCTPQGLDSRMREIRPQAMPVSIYSRWRPACRLCQCRFPAAERMNSKITWANEICHGERSRLVRDSHSSVMQPSRFVEALSEQMRYISDADFSNEQTHLFVSHSPRSLPEPLFPHMEAEVRQINTYEISHRSADVRLSTSQFSYSLSQRLPHRLAQVDHQMLRDKTQSSLYLSSMGTCPSRGLQSLSLPDHVSVQHLHHLRDHPFGSCSFASHRSVQP